MRVVVVEDNALLRSGVIELLTQGGLTVVGQASDCTDLSQLVDDLAPDVVVLDIRMPPSYSVEGLVAAESLRAQHGRRIGILLLSHHVEVGHALDLLDGGVEGIGYLLKDRVLDPGELVDAIRRVGEGGTAIDPLVIQHLLKRRRADERLAALTERESDVLAQMAQGRSNKAIATQLHLSGKTVESHTGHIFAKLGLGDSPDEHRRVLAVLTFLRGADGHEVPVL
ncbi:MAG: response regulator transcription factor [Candidatus Nanopelagicales bacterium]